MALFNAYDRTKQLSELGTPYEVGSGVVTPATQRQSVLRNIANSTTFTLAMLSFIDNVVAGVAQASKALVLDANKGAASYRNMSAPPIIKQPAPAAKTTSVTLTAAELIGGIITGAQGAAAAATYTLPLASALETALLTPHPGLQNDDAFDFSVINISTVAAETITIATNTGWTLVGDMLLAANATGDESVGKFRARRTAANTYTLYRVG